MRLLVLLWVLSYAAVSAALAAETDLAKFNYKWLIEPKYEDAGSFSEGLWPVKKDGLWGYVDSADNAVIDFRFAKAGSFCNGMVEIAMKDGEKECAGVIDKQGRTILEPRKEFILQHLYFWVWIGDKEAPIPFYNEETKKYGFMNLSRDVKIAANSSFASHFIEGLAPVGSGDYSGFMDQSGNWIIPPHYRRGQIVYSPRNGFFPFRAENGLWGYMNMKEEVVLEPQFSEVGRRLDRSCPRVVVLGKEIGLIDDNLKVIVLDPKYGFDVRKVNFLSAFWAGVVFLEKKEPSRVAVNVEGKILFSLPEEHVEEPIFRAKGYYPIATSDPWISRKPNDLPLKYYLLNDKGEMLLPPIFDRMRASSDGLIAVKSGDCWGLLEITH